MKKHPGGRPSVVTETVIAILVDAFSSGCTDKEACTLAQISEDALYDYQNKNPEFADRKFALREDLILKARKQLVKGISESTETAKWFLTKKRKEEFGEEINPQGGLTERYFEAFLKEGVLKVKEKTLQIKGYTYADGNPTDESNKVV